MRVTTNVFGRYMMLICWLANLYSVRNVSQAVNIGFRIWKYIRPCISITTVKWLSEYCTPVLARPLSLLTACVCGVCVAMRLHMRRRRGTRKWEIRVGERERDYHKEKGGVEISWINSDSKIFVKLHSSLGTSHEKGWVRMKRSKLRLTVPFKDSVRVCLFLMYIYSRLCVRACVISPHHSSARPTTVCVTRLCYLPCVVNNDMPRSTCVSLWDHVPSVGVL